MAMTLEDVLARRTRIMLEDAERGAGVAPEVAALMARELGWSSEDPHAQAAQYRALVNHQLDADALRRGPGGSVKRHLPKGLSILPPALHTAVLPACPRASPSGTASL